MHAASVHPEPGSNSRKYCILSPFGAKIYSRAFVALLLFVLSFFFTLRIVRDSTSHFLCLLCTYLFVVQFSMTVLFAVFAFARRLDYYITLPSLCQYFFQNFFKFFSKHPLGRQLHYFITLYLSCQVVFKNFFINFFTRFFRLSSSAKSAYNLLRTIHTEVFVCK